MKKYPFFALFSAAILLLTACNKDNDNATDPRDAYVGTYTITANYICSDCFGNFWSNTYTSMMRVDKGANANELLFTDSFQTNHPVTLNGSSFSVKDFAVSGGGIGTGGGSFGSNSINYTIGTSYGSTCSLCTEEGNGFRN